MFQRIIVIIYTIIRYNTLGTLLYLPRKYIYFTENNIINKRQKYHPHLLFILRLVIDKLGQKIYGHHYFHQVNTIIYGN